MNNLNGRVKRLEAEVLPATPAYVHLGADGSIGLYQAGRLAKDLGTIIAKIYGGFIPPATEKPGPAGPETLEEVIARIWGSNGS